MAIPDDIRPEHIASLLSTERYGRSLDVLDATDSTNDDAMARALAGAPSGHVVVADQQRAGRGARGRVWASPAGSDLYVSIVERPDVEQAQLPPLTLAVGLGVADAVDRILVGANAPRGLVKWPNDVWLGARKCAGVLVEAVAATDRISAVVIGIGLNVNRTTWPPELAAIATSLRDAGGAALDRGPALATLLDCVERWVDRFVAEGPAPIVDALDARLAFRNQRVRCEGIEGSLVGIAASGAVRIATTGGVRELIAGTLIPLDALATEAKDAT